jgi:hypothetical protein
VFAAYMLSSPITPLFVYIMLTAVVVVFAAWMVWGEQVRGRERSRLVRSAPLPYAGEDGRSHEQ